MARGKIALAKLQRGTIRILSTALTGIILTVGTSAQSPSTSPSPAGEGRYSVKARTEIGGRWVDVNGAENKFRSDFNFRSGFRIFDSSVVIEDNGDKSDYKVFDSALIMASGWGSDPSGYIRANVERDGIYRLDTSIRRVGFYNYLNNHAIADTRINYHNHNTRRNFGDMDLTILPENPKIRFRLGASYNISNGPFTTTTRASNAFLVDGEARTKAYDLRAGADGKLLGFNLAFTYGYRTFSDRSSFSLTGPQEGSNVDNYDFISMQRTRPITGRTHFGVLSLQRTFAEKFDFTARVLHSLTSNEFRWDETAVYYNNSTTVITRDQINVAGDSTRPQTRGDLGLTWRITGKFRLSDTFTFDGFNLNGGNLFAQDRTTSTSATITPTRETYYSITRYRRYMNLFEGDYQFNDRVGVNIGYRFARREATILLTGFNIRNAPPTVISGLGESEHVENTTHTVIAGTRIKPMKNWAIYGDIEKGKADTVFTRAGNADFTNFRIRSQMRFDKVAANVSYISKDSEIPTDTSRPVPRITDTTSRTFSATLDWYPIDEVSLSGGYNYLHLTSQATVNFSTPLLNALSEYFVRDSYYYIDATIKPHKRITFFGSYRWNKDRAYGDRAIPGPTTAYLLGGYPFDFKTPEVKAAIRLNKYIDWNIGYQYYDYKESPAHNIQWAVPFQNYSAHMPYTSVRIYLGKGSGDR
ncbi:MAG: hypothetical protein ABL984_18535 [Pyrinomonadaceae bacterium]